MKKYEIVGKFTNGFARVSKLDKFGLRPLWNFINEQGKLVSKDWFESVNSFGSGGVKELAKVYVFTKLNFINQDGKLVSSIWFDDTFMTRSQHFVGVIIYKKGHSKYNYMDKNGNLLIKEWADYCSNFTNGVAHFDIGTNKYTITENGEIK